MAVKYAVANGNWSAGATWNGGTVPVTGDDVYSNNFRVTINVATVDAAFLTNASLASPAINSGGGFTTSVNCAISSNIVWGSASNVVANKLLIISTGNTVNMTGTITNGPVTATSATTAPIVEVLAGATLNYNGGALVVTATTTTGGFVFISSFGTTNINADVTTFINNNANPWHILVQSGSQMTITGNILVRNTAGYGPINQLGGSTLTIIGNITYNTSGSAVYCQTPNASIDCVSNFTGNIIHSNSLAGGSGPYIIQNAGNDTRFKGTLVINTFTRNGTTGIQISPNRGIMNVTTNAYFTDNFTTSLYRITTGTNITVNFTGNLKGSNTNYNNCWALYVDTAPVNLTLNIYGNVEGGDYAPSNVILGYIYLNYGLFVNNTTATVTGNIVAIGSSLSESPGLFSRTTPNVFIRRAVTGAAPWYTAPYQGQVRFLTTSPEFQVSKQDNTTPTLTDPALLDYPSINNVRQGVTYGFLSYTGNLIVPPPANVSAGYNYDSSGSVTGTAVLTPNDLFTAIATSSDPVAERLRNVSTVQITGDQLQAAFNT